MKTKWSKNIPLEDGWYWIKYRGKRGIVKCPARFYRFIFRNKQIWVAQSARNDLFGENAPDRTLRFGPRIEEP